MLVGTKSELIHLASFCSCIQNEYVEKRKARGTKWNLTNYLSGQMNTSAYINLVVTAYDTYPVAIFSHPSFAVVYVAGFTTGAILASGFLAQWTGKLKNPNLKKQTTSLC